MGGVGVLLVPVVEVPRPDMPPRLVGNFLAWCLGAVGVVLPVCGGWVVVLCAVSRTQAWGWSWCGRAWTVVVVAVLVSSSCVGGATFSLFFFVLNRSPLAGLE